MAWESQKKASQKCSRRPVADQSLSPNLLIVRQLEAIGNPVGPLLRLSSTGPLRLTGFAADPRLAVRRGFEPRLKAPKTSVLPLHHRTASLPNSQKIPLNHSSRQPADF